MRGIKSLLVIIAFVVILIGAFVVIIVSSIRIAPAPREVIPGKYAMEAVRQFENDASLRFRDAKVADTESVPDSLRLYSHPFYVVRSLDEQASWCVDATTAFVLQASYFEHEPVKSTRTLKNPQSKDECRRIAEAFVKKRYRGFINEQFNCTRGHWSPTDSEFEWRGLSDRTCDSVTVRVDPKSGAVTSYEAEYGSYLLALKPRLSPERAEKIAISAAELDKIDKINGKPLLSLDRSGRLIWTSLISGWNQKDDYLYYWNISVDAVTGDVLSLEGSSGGMRKKRPADKQ